RSSRRPADDAGGGRMSESTSGVVAYEQPSGQAIAVPPDHGTPLLEVRNLQTWFPIRRGVFSTVVGHVKAVDDVSFDIAPGRTLGLVGESGCGKTSVGRTLLPLIPTTGATVRHIR